MHIRQSNSRGSYQNTWLQSKHSFSFGEYFDAERMGFSLLRVINDDTIQPNAGFPTHPHNNMEIITYVMQGELEHRDSMGNGSVIGSGDIQRLSAGSGITHSEFNPSADNQTHLLQIWLLPSEKDIEPSYAQENFPDESKQGKLKLVVSPDGREDSIQATSDSLIYASLLSHQESLSYEFSDERCCYLHLAQGKLKFNEHELEAGDAVLIEKESKFDLVGIDEANFLLFDLPRV